MRLLRERRQQVAAPQRRRQVVGRDRAVGRLAQEPRQEAGHPGVAAAERLDRVVLDAHLRRARVALGRAVLPGEGDRREAPVASRLEDVGALGAAVGAAAVGAAAAMGVGAVGGLGPERPLERAADHRHAPPPPQRREHFAQLLGAQARRRRGLAVRSHVRPDARARAELEQVALGEREERDVLELGLDHAPQLVEPAQPRPVVEVERDAHARRAGCCERRLPRGKRARAERRRDARHVEPLGAAQQDGPVEGRAVELRAEGRVTPLVVRARAGAVVDHVQRGERRVGHILDSRLFELEPALRSAIDDHLAHRSRRKHGHVFARLTHKRGCHRHVQLRTGDRLHHHAGSGSERDRAVRRRRCRLVR